MAVPHRRQQPAFDKFDASVQPRAFSHTTHFSPNGSLCLQESSLDCGVVAKLYSHCCHDGETGGSAGGEEAGSHSRKRTKAGSEHCELSLYVNR